jgi:hypothetical protein
MVWRGDETKDTYSADGPTEKERVTGQESRIPPGC